MRHGVHVAGEDLFPRQDRRDPDREYGLQQLALETVFLLQQQGTCKLLADRAAALEIAAKRVPRGAEGGAEVERAVREEALILARNHRVAQHKREGVARHTRWTNQLFILKAASGRLLDLTGGKDRLEQLPVRKIPAVALGDDI